MPGRAETVVVVGEDRVRLGDDPYLVTDRVDRGVDVVDPEVDQGGGGVAVEQEAGALEVEEQQPRRVEPGPRLVTEEP